MKKENSEQKKYQPPDLSRREFVRTVRNGALLLVLPQVLSCRAQAPTTDTTYSFEFLEAIEAKTVEAVTARILPTDNLPGAQEAHAVHFIDHMLATSYKDKQQLYREGLRNLDQLSKNRFSRRFYQIEPSEQDKLLSEIERLPKTDWKEAAAFFSAIRLHTIQGTFSDPKYFGNRDRVGWILLEK